MHTHTQLAQNVYAKETQESTESAIKNQVWAKCNKTTNIALDANLNYKANSHKHRLIQINN